MYAHAHYITYDFQLPIFVIDSVSQVYNELFCIIEPYYLFRHVDKYFIFKLILSVWQSDWVNSSTPIILDS